MSQNSFPKVDAPFTDDQWKNLFLTLGRGIIDRGGSPYKLTARDSVANTVTIGVDTRDGRNFAVLDGFLHTMDAPEQVSVPAVTTDTVYEVGLLYDPTQHAAPGGPITLTSWVAPGDNTGGKSRLVFYRMTRKANLALGSTPYTSERPCAVPTFSVSSTANLPTNSLVLVDSLAFVRSTGTLHRADISESGTVTWTQVGGSVNASDIDTKITAALGGSGWKPASAYPTGDSIVRRWPDGVVRVGNSIAHPQDALNVGTADGRYMRQGDDILGGWILKDENNPVPWEVVQGSTKAYSNTNLGSTWATVAVNSAGRFGRYPSALKYKKNVREWKLTPDTAYGITPVKYEDKENGDTRVGFVADSYVNSLPELVEIDPATGEVEGWRYLLTCVAQQVAIRDLNDRLKTTETMLEGVLERLADLETGTL